MTTVLDMLNATKRYVLSGHREPMNVITGDHTDTDTTIHFGRELGAIAPGAYLSIGLEIVYVWDINGSNRTATVQRGQLGSSQHAMTDGQMLTVNAKFPDFSIMEALNDSLVDMSARGVFRVAQVTFTFIANREGYDLTGATSVIDQLDCRYDYPGPERNWPLLRNFEIRRNSDSEFASTYQVLLRDEAQPGRDVRVTYATNFTPITSLTQTHEDLGLPVTADDIPPLGAGLRLQYLREVQRNFNEAQPDPRRSGEVPSGAQLQATAGLQRLYDRRIQTEAIRLQKAYPHRRKVI